MARSTAKNKQDSTIVMDSYKDAPVLKIFRLRDDGHRSDYPELSFGRRKAKFIVDNYEAIKKFAEGEDEEG